MREIIFRGKDHFTGEWIEGYCSKVGFGNGFFDAIVKFDGGSTQPHRVDPETIGQFTGLLDKDGVRIFEGDKYEVTDGDEWVVGSLVAKIDGDTLSTDSRVIGAVIGNIHEQKN